MTGSTAPSTDGVDFWQRYRAGWHVLAGATVLLVAMFVTIDQPAAGRGGSAMALLAALLGWYALVGARALRHDQNRRAVVYFVGVAVILTGVYPITMATAFLLFMLNPQVFAMISGWRLRIAVMILLYGQIVAFTIYRAGFTVHALAAVGVWVLVPMAFAFLLGAYISGIIKQSRQRAELIDELTRTRAELADERHEAGVHAERERLAAEIHDTLAQGFTSILMLTQAARVGFDRDRDGVEGQLELIERTARENVAEARALVAALTPPDLAGRGLVEALIRLSERHTRDTGVPVSVSVSGEPAGAAPGIDVVLLRATQEALTNVRRHASASTVRIELSRDLGSAAVEVTDDGRGFDAALVCEGYGLPGLRSRATAFGGTCTVRSAPGAGTSVRVCLPEMIT